MTPYWFMISSLLHIVGLRRPRVYYILTNFVNVRRGRGVGGKAALGPPQYANALVACQSSYYGPCVSDNDECSSDDTNSCSQTCTNTAGSYTCGCNQDYQLNSDGISCSGM